MAHEHIGRRAVVVGAGMGGLAAAAALADFFEQVVVLERDRLPADAAHRPGTPQGRHLHAILGGGERALDELFPDFSQELAAGGAVPLRVALDFRSEFPGFDPYPQRDLGIVIHSMSRPLIETTARRRVQQFGNIVIREGCRVLRFVAADDGNSVTAVGFEDAAGNRETLSAELIVDASGRGNLTEGLLKQTAKQTPTESAIGVDAGYATSVFAIPDDAPDDWKVLLVTPQAPESSCGALMMPLEGGRWMVSLSGRYDQKPPGDSDGFLEFVRQLRRPTLFNALRGATRLGDVVRYGFPASIWRHYEQLPWFPRGLLPFGDAICRFNPIWGQGMTVAAQEALLLRRLLSGDPGRDPLAGLAPKFFAAAAKLIEVPWTQAAIPDFAMPQATGQRPADLEQRLRFGGALQRLAAQDPEVHRLVVEVRHLLKPSSALRDPALIARVTALMAEA